jgi:DNA-binding winged helix-turn-helix (wHTH) protein
MESAPTMKTTQATSFDGWVLRADIGELTKDGRKIRLQQLPLLVLQELLARPGDLVTREQLIARLWPKGVVEFDTGLNTAVRKLRVALDDVGEVPRYIETLPRKGYRFIGAIDPPVETAPTPSMPAAESESAPAAERRAADRRAAAHSAATPAARVGALSSRRGVAFAAAFLLLLAVAVLWWLRQPDQSAARGMTIRLSGFQLLSPDLPATLREAVDAEVTAAFSRDGVVGVQRVLDLA